MVTIDPNLLLEHQQLLVKSVRVIQPQIVVSGTGVLAHAIDAVRRGAWDYITKPIDPVRLYEVGWGI